MQILLFHKLSRLANTIWAAYIALCLLHPHVVTSASFGSFSEKKWLIELTINRNVYKNIKRNKSKEVSFRPDTIKLNGEPLKIKDLHTRGKTTLKYWRKSYTVSLDEKVKFEDDKRSIEMDHFYLISMSLDKNYFHNRLAFQCLEELELFPLFYHYVEVMINGASEGLYLLVQRPSDYVLDDLGSSAILRRASSDFISEGKFAKSTQQTIQRACAMVFKEIGSTGKRKGQDLYRYLDARINLTQYFTWLAFNYLVHNGDYTDEVFYYLLPDTSSLRFGIIPWDFDDIFVMGPHGGLDLRNERLGDQLIFSSEDRLDRIIARDTFLYKQYLFQFHKVMSTLNTDLLREIFDDIHKDLSQYFQSDSVVNVSRYDLRPVESYQDLQENLELIFSYLNKRAINLRQIVSNRL